MNVSFERLKQLFSTNAEFVCIEGEYRLILVVCKSLEGWKGGGREGVEKERNHEEENR